MECIDVFCHFLPSKYTAAIEAVTGKPPRMLERAQQIPAMVDLPARLKIIEEFPGYHQIISLSSPPTEVLAASQAVELSRLANEELASTVAAAKDRIRGFVATLPLNDVAASLQEAHHALDELGALGVQVFTSVLSRPLDESEFLPLFEFMAERNLPILLHPTRAITVPDYPGEEMSKFDLWWAIGWPYETTLALVRLALSGLFDRLPDLKIIAHHVGGYLPMLEGRLGPGMELLGTRNPPGTEQYVKTSLQEPLLEACKRFYADTASFGSLSALECGSAFFGAERLLFASDMPFDPGGGPDYIRSTLAAIDAMTLSTADRRAILVDNARRLFKLEDF